MSRFGISKKNIEKLVSNISMYETSFKSVKISKIRKIGEKYIFLGNYKGRDVKFITYYQGLLKKGSVVDIEGKMNQVKFGYSDFEVRVNSVKINITDSFRNLVSIKKEFEDIFNYAVSNNFSFSKIRDTLEKKGASESKLEKLDEFIKILDEQTVYDKLSLMSLDDIIVHSLFFKYKEDAYNIVKQNPYILIKEFGLPIKTCDKIAKLSGTFSKDDTRRLTGVLYEIFRDAKKNGHSLLSKEILMNKLNRYRDGDSDVDNFISELNFLIDTEDFAKVITKVENGSGEIEEIEEYALMNIYKSEEFVAKTILNRSKLTNLDKSFNTDKILNDKFSEFEEEKGFPLTDSQKQAIEMTVHNQVSIITGGPGTGKTTVQSAIFRVLSEIYGEDNILMIAPTGIAAKNISKKSGTSAKTIHSAIGLNPFGFLFDDTEKLKEKVVIIDEMSMVSLDMFLKILKKTKRTTKIVMVGDPDQLFSIEHGQVLSDIIKSGKIPTVSLNEGFRFKGSVLVNADKIRKGQSDLVFDKDFLFVQISDEYEKFYESSKLKGANKYDLENISYTLDKKYEILYKKRLSDAFKHYLPTFGKESIKILTPFNSLFFGVSESNSIIGDVFRGDEISIEKYSRIFKVGDVVINTLNNKELGIMNGDNGIIRSIYEDYTGKRKIDAMDIDFGGELVTVKGSQIKNIQHSYAMTIHKSQGSGFPIIIIPLFENYIQLYSRKLLYTAITRSQQKVIFIGRKELLKTIIENDMPRKSLLLSFLLKNQ